MSRYAEVEVVNILPSMKKRPARVIISGVPWAGNSMIALEVGSKLIADVKEVHAPDSLAEDLGVSR